MNCYAGAGRRVSENCEQLWAELKPVTQITRYMAKPNYLDCLDVSLNYIAECKLDSFVGTMVTQEKHARDKLGKCSSCNNFCFRTRHGSM